MNSSVLTDSRTGDKISLVDAVLESMPNSGGLYSITDFPEIRMHDIEIYSRYPYQELAYEILSRFDWGLPPGELRAIIDASYGEQWRHPDITPVKRIGDTNLYSLHLGYGPTFAFKNIALEFLPRLLSRSIHERMIHVLGASSGDTVNAAHSGVCGTNIRSIFLMPDAGPSEFQRLQATNGIVDNPGAFTIFADTSFDSLQDIVKSMHARENADLKEQYGLMSFNSINIARILAQTVYYFRAYAELLKNGNIQKGDPVVYVVPSGNFGDALAGYYAYKMGLPIERIIVATNENDMLHTFFQTGKYEPKKIQITNSPSMDISRSSNFERLLFDICDYDAPRIRGFYSMLVRDGSFTVDSEILQKIQKIFSSVTSTDKERLDTIATMGVRYDHWIDPHTAAAVSPWIQSKKFLEYVSFHAENVPVIFLETSHVIQFVPELRHAGILLPEMDEYDRLISRLRSQQAREGENFLRVGRDPREIQRAIEHVMRDIFPKKFL